MSVITIATVYRICTYGSLHWPFQLPGLAWLPVVSDGRARTAVREHLQGHACRRARALCSPAANRIWHQGVPTQTFGAWRSIIFTVS